MLLRMTDINKFYNGNQVLSHVSLTVEDHDRIGLVGVNGCGKSTLLRILTEQELPDHLVEGDGEIARSAKTSIGYLEQMGGLDRESTVWEEMRSVFRPLLETQERFSPAKAAAVRDCLLAAGKYGLAGLPLAYKIKFGWCMLRYKMAFKDGVALYGKYVGNWGGEATRWRFDAVQDGNVVRSVTLCPSAKLHLEVKVSRTTLREQDTYDMAAVRVRILDENGTPAPYAQFPVQFTVEGSAALVGPQTAVAEGGMTGTYLRTVGTAGEAALTVSAPQTQPVVLRFTIEKEDAVWN